MNTKEQTLAQLQEGVVLVAQISKDITNGGNS